MRRSLALLLPLLLAALAPQFALADESADALSQWQQKSARKLGDGAAPLDPSEQIVSSPAVRRNPFNAETVLRYSLPYDGEVELAVYDLLGRRVRILESGFRVAGEYALKWDGKNEKGGSVASGVYFYRLQAAAPDGTRIRKSSKMTLLQ